MNASYSTYNALQAQQAQQLACIKQAQQLVSTANAIGGITIASNPSLIGTTNTTAGLGQAVYYPNVGQPLCGNYMVNAQQHITVPFVQANGMVMALDIDITMMAMIQQVSDYHAQLNGVNSISVMGGGLTQPPKHTPMVEGEFSLDEMDQAEKIMEELGA